MSLPGPTGDHPRAKFYPCEICIYGRAVFLVTFQYAEEEYELEKDVCERCMSGIQGLEEQGLVRVWQIWESLG